MVELVGRGGMGLVFRAYDACLQRTVAVKLLDPLYAKNDLARERFIREARAAAGVAHENVVTIHHVECVEEKGLSFMVMQFIRGRSLQERLDAGGPLPVREAVRIATAVAGGLAAAHATGLIHRDIKPGNILIEQPSGRVLAHRLRPRPADRGREAHADGLRRRDAPLHEPGTGPRRDGRSSRRICSAWGACCTRCWPGHHRSPARRRSPSSSR